MLESRAISVGIVAVGLCGLLTIFQNCGKIAHGGSGESNGSGDGSTTVSNETGGGTGNGYDGKTYDLVGLVTCTDGSHVLSSITFYGSDAYLVRDNCQPLAKPVRLDPSTYSVNPTTMILSYNGSSYADSASSPPIDHSNTPFTRVQCDSNTNTYPIYHLVLTYEGSNSSYNFFAGVLNIQPTNTATISSGSKIMQLTPPQSASLPALYTFGSGVAGGPNSLYVYLTQQADSTFSAELYFNLTMSDGSQWGIDTGPGIPCTVTFP
jgi:hypothetical protein